MWRDRALEVFAICMRLNIPSYILAPPPEPETMMSGSPLSVERSMSLVNFSPTTDPMDPMMKHVLTRALGQAAEVEVYITHLTPGPDDLVMICSDGLTNYVPEQAVKAVLSDTTVSLERRVEILVDEARKGGGGDNITVILMAAAEQGKWKKFMDKFF